MKRIIFNIIEKLLFVIAIFFFGFSFLGLLAEITTPTPDQFGYVFVIYFPPIGLFFLLIGLIIRKTRKIIAEDTKKLIYTKQAKIIIVSIPIIYPCLIFLYFSSIINDPVMILSIILVYVSLFYMLLRGIKKSL